MARTFSLSLVVALLLVFVVIEASRAQTNQENGQKIQSRGTTRYNSKPTTTEPSVSTSTIKSQRDKSSSRSEAASNLRKHNETHLARESPSRSSNARSLKTIDSVATSRTNSRHVNPGDTSRNRSRSHVIPVKEEVTKNRQSDNQENVSETQTPRRQTASKRISSDASLVWVDDAKLEHEVFTKSPGQFRSRTGRKIYNEKETRRAVPSTTTENVDKVGRPSGRSESEQTRPENLQTIENVGSANASRKKDVTADVTQDKIKDRDVLLSGSESVRVDIPLAVRNDEDVNLLTTISSLRQTARPIKEKNSNDIARSKKTRQSDRSKSRGRSPNESNTETANSTGNSRRGSSKFDGTAETNERSSNTRHRSKNAGSRSRSKSRDTNATEGRSRVRTVDSETNGRTETRRVGSSTDRRAGSEGKRRTKDGRLKVAETKVEQDARTQSRSRSRSASSNLDVVTTAFIPKVTIAETTTVPTLETEITTAASVYTTTRSSTVARTSTSTEQAFRNKGRGESSSSRSKKQSKEDFFNHGLGFRGRKIGLTEGTSSSVADLKATTPKSETQLRGNPGWTLRRRPSHVGHDAPPTTTFTSVNRDQTNEIISPTESSSGTETPSLNNAKSGRRGTKKPKAKDESDTVSPSVTTKSVTRGSKTFSKSEDAVLPKKIEIESDNYPPAFRARLNQLKNSNTKSIGVQTTTRSSVQATKSNPATLFSERSKMKLDLARRLIKPELNFDENDFDVTTVAYSGKPREISAVSESRNVEKTTKPSNQFSANASLISENAQKEKSVVGNRWKTLVTRKLSPKDRNNEGLLRLLANTKNRSTSERTVTSAEGKSSTESNVVTRGISHRSTMSRTETTATTIGTTRVRPATSQTVAASREEISTLANTEPEDANDIITTVEPLKLNKISAEVTEINKQEHNVNEAQKKKIATTATSDVTPIAETLKVQTITEFPQEITLPATITTPSSAYSSSASSEKVYPVYPVYIPTKKRSSEEKIEFESETTKNNFRPRYTKQQQSEKVAVSMVTSRTVGPTSRYIRKKAGVFTPYDAVPKPLSTEPPLTKRRDFRPRTATYRRHSEVPTSQLVVQNSTTVETTSVTITPKPTKFSDQLVTPSTRSSPSEPLVSVRIDTSNDTTSQVSGITESSNGNSGNSNIFTPARVNAGNATLLEQLRSTVAPLLNNLGNKTPVFSGAYSNVDTGNSAPRVTPNGSPPRFSARYKGAELFVRKPSVGQQALVPSLTTSSTTASTPLEVFPTKVPEASEAVAPSSWAQSIYVTTPSSDLTHIDANSLR